MVDFDLVLLSSSPPVSSRYSKATTPPSHQQRATTVKCSPAALSPGDRTLNGSKVTLESGSRATPVPDGAMRGFATAGSLVKSHHFSLDVEAGPGEISPPHSRENGIKGVEMGDKLAKKPRKQATKELKGTEDAETKPKKPWARKVKGVKETDRNEDLLATLSTTSSLFAQSLEFNVEPPTKIAPAPTALKEKTTKLRKPRAKKEKVEKSETGNIRAKGKITKPRAADKLGEKRGKKETKFVSPHFTPDGVIVGHAILGQVAEVAEETNAVKDQDTVWEVPSSPRHRSTSPEKLPNTGEPLALDEAVTRRRDWTPVKDDIPFAASLDSASKESDTVILQKDYDAFTNIVSGFAYSPTGPAPALQSSVGPLNINTVTKRRRVELVQVPNNPANSRDISPEKGRAPKKKARTITDLVTGQYAPKDPALASPIISDLFVPHNTTIKVPLNDVPASASIETSTNSTRRKPLSKSSMRKKEVKSKPKKATTKVLSKRDLVEDKLLSPNSAIQRLNKQDVLFGTSSQLALEESPTTIRHIQLAIHDSEQEAAVSMGAPDLENNSNLWRRLQRIKGNGGLWAASARDKDGQFLQRQNDVYIPEPDRTQDFPLLMDGKLDDRDDSDIDSLEAPTHCSSEPPTPPENPSEELKSMGRERPRNLSFENIDDYPMECLPASDSEANTSFLDIDDFASPAGSPPTAPSSARPPSSTLLSKAPPRNSQAPSFKTNFSKPRSSTVRVSGTCSSKPQQPATSLLSTPAKRRSYRFVDIEEILDSEDDEAFSPTPPRISKAHSQPLDFEPPLADSAKTTEEVVKVLKVPITHLQWAPIKEDIFTRITHTIRALPPTTDPQKPSWHEKILMYDPIILEEFVAFVNGTADIRAYRRASPKQVKAWNKILETRGEGVLEVEDDASEVLAVEKPLETWMIQAWCQEMSICCISKVYKGKSSAKKGLY